MTVARRQPCRSLRAFPPERRRTRRALCLASTLLGSIALIQGPARAIEFGEGDWRGSLDTTISHGLTYRVEPQDEGLLSDTNGDDGNRNYDVGIVSNTSKFTSDLEVSGDRLDLFVRATGFLDFENEDATRDRTPLSEGAMALAGQDVEILDAYVSGWFETGNVITDVRAGNLVLNWGESTFIPGGGGVINPVNASRLRLPGSELREALVPIPAVALAVAPNDVVAVEGFYQFGWEKTEIDPVGTYFSVVDYAGAGATKVVVPVPGILVTDAGLSPESRTGLEPLLPVINADLAAARAANQALQEQQLGLPAGSLEGAAIPPAPQPDTDPDFFSVGRGVDREPGDSGQGGLAMQYFTEGGAELGIYFINFHSRLPVLSARTGSTEGLQAALAATSAVVAPTSQTATAITAAVTEEVQAQVAAGLVPPDQALSVISATVSAQVSGIAQMLAIDRYGRTAEYFIEYPENLQAFGLSFNTRLGRTDWALQGEVSLRPDAPLQRSEATVLAEGLSPLFGALGLAADPAGLGAYLAAYQSVPVQGYVERHVSQAQVTATRVFGPRLNADSLAFVAEAVILHVHDMPDEPLESPAGGTLTDYDADATSVSVQFAAALDYTDVVGGVNFSPYLRYRHDVSGHSPSPVGFFIEGLSVLTVGLRADYLSRWQADVGYTRYDGTGNELSDRDHVYAVARYSF